MSDDKMLGRIRKLLAMAEAEGLPDAARKSYNEKAAALIAQYGINAALIAAHAPVATAPVREVFTAEAPYATEKVRLLYTIADAFGCKGIQLGAGQIEIFGMPEDLERAELLWTSLLVQQAHGLATALPVNPRESIRAFRNSWLIGFRGEIGARLRSTERTARSQAEQDAPAGTSVALVLASRTEQVTAAFTTAYPPSAVYQTRSTSRGSGWRAGSAAGRRADLGGSRVGGSGRRAVGR